MTRKTFGAVAFVALAAALFVVRGAGRVDNPAGEARARAAARAQHHRPPLRHPTKHATRKAS